MTNDDLELELIRKKKMERLLQMQKQLEEQRKREQQKQTQRQRLLDRALLPEAKMYLEQIKKKMPAVAKQIEDIVLYLVLYRGLYEPLNQIDIMYIERKITGQEPKITIKRRGKENKTISDYFKENIE